MRSKPKSFQPQRKTNPEVLAKKIEKQKKQIDELVKTSRTNQQLVKTILHSNETYLNFLASFARHELGNAVQNIAAILQSIKQDIDPTVDQSINTALYQLDATLKNFGKLIHPDKKDSFTLQELMTAIKSFVRSELAVDKIAFETNYDVKDPHIITQPFQTLMQLLHNFIINSKKAIKARETIDDSVKKIVLDANIIHEECVLTVKDTGCGIPASNIGKIFDYGFSTTDGSGIGLFYAKRICDEIGGNILVSSNSEGFSTLLTLKFPIDGNTKDSCD